MKDDLHRNGVWLWLQPPGEWFLVVQPESICDDADEFPEPQYVTVGDR